MTFLALIGSYENMSTPNILGNQSFALQQKFRISHCLYYTKFVTKTIKIKV